MPGTIVWVHMQVIGPGTRGGFPPTAILMDHDAGIRKYLEMILTSVGFRVLSFATAEGAQAALIGLQGQVSILICDVDLRDTDGMAFPQSIARRDPKLPVLLTSAWGELPASAGRFPSLLKPFRPMALIQLLSKLTNLRYSSAHAA